MLSLTGGPPPLTGGLASLTGADVGGGWTNGRVTRVIRGTVAGQKGYKELIPESFVNSSELLEKQNNRSNKGYHEVPPPLTRNYMPPKRDLRLIDEHFKSESVDVSTVSSSADKTVKTVEITHKSDNETEFKNSIMTQFYDDKGIKREYSVARTPHQNGVAEKRNKTLIEAVRTMLVVSKLPTTFWVEAVNTACYVLTRALVTKPHNKTPYELIRGRPPLIDFMKPFGCLVTILNTRDNLDWLFDIDSLIISINYVPVVTGNQTNGIARTKEKLVAGQDEKKKELKQEYILIPVCTTGPLIYQDAKDSIEDARKKAPKVDAGEASNNGGQDNQVSRNYTGIFDNTYDDDVLEEEVDMNNVDSSYAIPEATKFLKDHPQEQVIGSLETPEEVVHQRLRKTLTHVLELSSCIYLDDRA
nr:putative ribonuclease H-like domain-containing protein [Tanacetum cinerariifolium]